MPDMKYDCVRTRFGDGDVIDKSNSLLYRVMGLNRRDGWLQDTIIVNRRFFIGARSVRTLPTDNFAIGLTILYERKTNYKPYRQETVESMIFQSTKGNDAVVLEEPTGWVDENKTEALRANRQEFSRKAQPFIQSILDSIGYEQTDFS